MENSSRVWKIRGTLKLILLTIKKAGELCKFNYFDSPFKTTDVRLWKRAFETYLQNVITY
jgi:hypothetical protein